MWVPGFLRRRPPTGNQVRKTLEKRFRKEQRATPYNYNKYLNNLTKNMTKEGKNVRTITLPNVMRMKGLRNARNDIRRKLENRFRSEQGRYRVRENLLNNLVTSVLRNNKNVSTMNLPTVANFGSDKFNPNNWTYVRKSMENTYRQYPGLRGNKRIIIARNQKNGTWRLATPNEIEKLNNTRVHYGTHTQ